MKLAKRKKLEAQGWRIGTVQEFLGLTDDEAAFIELKLALSDHFKKLRQRKNLSQIELAKRLKLNQSRIAKIEAGDPSVSLDVLVKSLLVMGTSNTGLARVIANGKRSIVA